MTSFKKHRWVLPAVAAVVALSSCSGGQKKVTEDEIALAKSTLQPYKRRLQVALKDGVREGTDYAILACSQAAPMFTKEHSTGGVQVGRTSHKLRNPKNAPKPWMESLLASYVENPADKTPRAVPLPDDRFGYVEPIYVQPLCTACHGDDLEGELAERLNKLYPNDQGKGFKDGDFRGLFWITMDRQDE
jgi:hypothetical protein